MYIAPFYKVHSEATPPPSPLLKVTTRLKKKSSACHWLSSFVNFGPFDVGWGDARVEFLTLIWSTSVLGHFTGPVNATPSTRLSSLTVVGPRNHLYLRLTFGLLYALMDGGLYTVELCDLSRVLFGPNRCRYLLLLGCAVRLLCSALLVLWFSPCLKLATLKN